MLVPSPERGKNAKYLAYTFSGQSLSAPVLRSEYRVWLWRPTVFRVVPPGLPWKMAAWWVMHWLRIFRNRDYSVLFISEGDSIVHRSCIVPAHFRCPFMAAEDVQISSTWTEPGHRNQGLGVTGLVLALGVVSRPDRRVWYLSREANKASIATCQRAGFELVGMAVRAPAWGMVPLSMFVMDSPVGLAAADQNSR